MKVQKIIILGIILSYIACLSCKNVSKDENQAQSQTGQCLIILFDVTVKDFKTNKEFSLSKQELPGVPVCNVQISDTVRICKSYGEKDWHVEQYHNYHGSETDHCELIKDVLLVSIDGIYTQ